MGILQNIRSFISKFDCFASTQFLRYKGEPQYSTATGGIISIIIIIIFIVLFINAAINVINKATVTATTNYSHQNDPELTTVTIGPNGNFMFAVNIFGINLTDTTKTVFEVILAQEQFTPIGIYKSYQEVSLVPCTSDHMNFGNDVLADAQKIGYKEWLCPPLNFKFQVQGKVTSDIFKQFSLTVKKCDTKKHSNCVNSSYIDLLLSNIGSFNLAVAVINKEINPSESTNYLKHYIEDGNYFAFTPNFAVQSKAHIQGFSIQTDQSLIPMSSLKTQEGLIITQLFDHYSIPVIFDTYARVIFKKSPITISHTRNFQKIDQFFSYVGGLIGTVVGLFFLINSYNQLCYLISISSKLFTYDKQRKIESQKFNFVYYVCFIGYKIVRCFGCFEDCEPMHVYDEAKEQMEKQLDVSYLFRRILLLEQTLHFIFEEHQVQTFRFLNKPTLGEGQKARLKFGVEARLNQKLKKDGYQEAKYTEEELKNIPNQADRQRKLERQESFDFNLSHSSYNTMNSRSIEHLKDRVKILMADSEKPENRQSHKILDNTNKILLNRLMSAKARNDKNEQLKKEDISLFIGRNTLRRSRKNNQRKRSDNNIGI